MFKTSTREEESRKEEEGGIKVKRGFREMERTGEEEEEEEERERGLQKVRAEGRGKSGLEERGEEGKIRGAGEEGGLNESRRECMR